MKPAFELPDDWFVENDGQRLVLDPEKVKAAFEARVALQGWQDMESAPKNGTPVLLRLAKPLHSNDIESYVPFAEIQEVIGWWEDGWRICFMEEGTADTHGYSSNFYMGSINPLPSQPTHWQPLPQPPAASDREERRPPPKEKP